MSLKTKVLIATPIYREAMSRMVASRAKVAKTCRNATLCHCEIRNESAVWRARNSLAADFIDSNCDWLYFWDDDITDASNGNLIDMLLTHGVPVIGGLYSTKGGNDAGRLYEGTSGRVQEVKYLGGGSMLIHRSVFDAIAKANPQLAFDPRPNEPQRNHQPHAYFEPFIHNKEDLSEDYAFCQRWQDCGGKVYADTSIVLAHWDNDKAYYV